MKKNMIYSIMIVVVLLIGIITFIEFKQTEAKDSVAIGSEDTEETYDTDKTNDADQAIVDGMDEPSADNSLEKPEDNTPTPIPNIIVSDSELDSEGTYVITNEDPPQLPENDEKDTNDSAKPDANQTIKEDDKKDSSDNQEKEKPTESQSKSKPEEDKVDQAAINEKRQEIAAIYAETDAILVKSSKGSGNVMAQLLGFSDELEAIAREAEVAMQIEVEALEHINECEDLIQLEAYEKEASDYLDRFTDQKDKILTAKQNQDIDQLTVELESMLKLIKEYVECLQEVT